MNVQKNVRLFSRLTNSKPTKAAKKKGNKPGKSKGTKTGHANKLAALFGPNCMMHFDMEKLQQFQHSGQSSEELDRRSTLRALNSNDRRQ